MDALSSQERGRLAFYRWWLACTASGREAAWQDMTTVYDDQPTWYLSNGRIYQAAIITPTTVVMQEITL